MAKGKFHEWRTEDGLMQLESWARDGLSDAQISKNMGISRNAYYQYLKKFDDINDAIKRGKRPVDLEVENALLKSALGYEVEETTTIYEDTDNGRRRRVEKKKKHIAPNVTAQIFWLKNRKPEQWYDRHHHEHGGEVTQNVNHMSELDRDTLKNLAKLDQLGDADDDD